MSIYNLEHCQVNPTLNYAQSLLYMIPKDTTEIVSKGGGSTIDVGKWLAKELKLKHTVIPTTAGTGSEVTKYVVLMVDGKKKTFTDEAYIPTSYVLDPKNVVTLPYLHTLASGLDALSQCVEASWSKNQTTESNSYAAAGMTLVQKNLLECLKNPTNEEARMNMLIAANMSGRAINITRTNVCHAISYPLTEWYGVPHGIACAMSLNYFAKKVIGYNFKPFFDSLNIPKYSFNAENIADVAIQSEKLKDCPFEITREDIIKALS